MTDRCPDPGAINAPPHSVAEQHSSAPHYGCTAKLIASTHSHIARTTSKRSKQLVILGRFMPTGSLGNNSGHGLISHPALWQDHLSEYLRTLD